ncbi:family 51 putative glycoside hydrolase [Podospora australis]|uniref:non-reducing end alpha-L-arabinofuranosidase n=1 Tax=Podospora australis TaxID=1536484 RepID=A0AAN6WUQ6_9PEZI|nr:family 51 putative glycoside hydrolase [Podospora australis]
MISLKPALLAALAALSAPCLAIDLRVRSTGGNKTTDIMYGLMHEDINNSGDGGIYAELISNRAFQGSAKFPSNLDGWSPVGGAVLSLQKLAQPLSSALPYSVNVAASTNANSAKIGLANGGYWGIDVKVQKYTGTFHVKGEYDGDFEVSLRSAITGEVFGRKTVSGGSVAGEWTEKEFELVPEKNAPSSNNTFVIEWDAEGVKSGSLDLNLISLFPPTFKGRKNGLRIDLAEALVDLKPTFLRFPGGNMLEGNTLDTYWKWNETLGPLKNRPGMAGVWEYQQTLGLGLSEYMNWADDMNLEPIVGVFAGLALDGNFVPEAEFDWVIQYALDEIEFLTGDANTTQWGAVRASLGYPKPWTVNYVEIGNEDWLAGRPAGFDSYKAYRFPRLMKAFNDKYPHIQIIASPSVFDGMTIPKGAAGDYHPYLTPDEFVQRFGRFDALTRDNLTLIGEAASTHPNGGIAWDGNLMPFPWWGGSVAEAIFLISAERNGDKIIGATYAPGLRNMNRWQWSMTQIQHAADPALTTLSTSYHVWRLIASHIIRTTLPVSAPSGAPNFNPLYYVAGSSAENTGVFKAAVYNSTSPVPVSLRFEGIEKEGAVANLTVLTGPSEPYGYNDPFTRADVVKHETRLLKAGKGGEFKFELPGLSVAVLETADKIKVEVPVGKGKGKGKGDAKGKGKGKGKARRA